MIRPGLEFKGVFFDRAKVVGAVDKATRKVLSKFGAFVRRTAKRSIRKRKTKSKPGQPPRSHTGLLKRHIYFGYEPNNRSVVIGPAKLSGKTEAPAVLEHGGEAESPSWRRRGKKKKRKVKISARPYMGPAFMKEKDELPELWKDSLKP